MKNPLRHCLALVAIAWALPTIIWSAPAEINYQGRLTDGNGDAVTGNVLMSLKLFDAATGGNEIYSENIGTVTLDNNGVYSFQFGAEGQSEVDARTTIALADGVTTSYSGSLASTPLSGTLAVADGTYNWNIVDGNPGQQATAAAQLANGFVIGITVTDGGEGYTAEPVVTINGNGTGATATAVVENGVLTAINVDSAGSGYTNATVSIAAPPAPFVVDFVSGTVSVNYESAPAAGTEIVATYEVNESSIVGALSAANAHWLELSVDGTAQSPRERVLSVPFAQVAGRLSSGNRLGSRIDVMTGALAHLFDNAAAVSVRQGVTFDGSVVGKAKPTVGLSNKYIRSVSFSTAQNAENTYASYTINYVDGEQVNSGTGMKVDGFYSLVASFNNPYPNKRVESITFTSSWMAGGGRQVSVNAVSIEEESRTETIAIGKVLTAGDWIFGFEQTDLINSTEYNYEFRCVDDSGNTFAVVSSQGQRIRLEGDTVCSSVDVVWSLKESPTFVVSNQPAIHSISFVRAD
jgi:hypothetical protein